jgi:hypothetical protein
LTNGGGVLSDSAATISEFNYTATGNVICGAGAIYAVGEKAVFGGSADLKVFRYADTPTGGATLACEFALGNRYFAYTASGSLVIGGEVTKGFIEFTPYFLRIEHTLERNRLDPCPTGVGISKHAVIGLLQGTKTLTLLEKADHWEIVCANSPKDGDIEILVYKDSQTTKIIWNLFHPFFNDDDVEITTPEREADFKQYRLPIAYHDDIVFVPDEPEEFLNYAYTQFHPQGPVDKLPIYYPGDSVVFVPETPIETPNVGVIPAIATEINRQTKLLTTISQASLLNLVGRNHFLNTLARTDWEVLDFNNKKASVRIKGKNKIEVVVR